MKTFLGLCMAVFLLLAFAAFGATFVLATSAPQEAVFVAMACFFGIIARIFQAEGLSIPDEHAKPKPKYVDHLRDAEAS